MVAVTPTGLIGPELGSGFDQQRLFAFWQDGKIFEQGPAEVRDFEQMLAVDGKAQTLEQVLTLPLRGASWSIQPPKGNDVGQTEFCQEALTQPANAGGMSTSLETVIAQMTAACLFRRAYFEKVWAAKNGRTVYDSIEWRPPSTCYLARDPRTAKFAGFKQRTWKGTDYVDVNIPPARAFVYIHGQHRNPLEGTSDLGTAYQTWITKQKLRFLWYSFLENQTMPKMIVKAGTADVGERDDLARRAATLKGAGVLGIGPTQDVTPYESGGNGAAEFQAAIRYCDQEMAGSVLAGFVELPNEGRGSYALSRDQTDFFLQARQAVAREMGAALTNFVLADLTAYNFGPDVPSPTFEFGNLTYQAIEDAVAMLRGLATAPAVRVPTDFVDQLTEKVAGYMDLDVAAVSKAIEGGDRGDIPKASTLPGLAARVDTAANLVADHQATAAQ